MGGPSTSTPIPKVHSQECPMRGNGPVQQARDMPDHRGLPRPQFWASKWSRGSSGFVRRHPTEHG